MLTGLLNRNAFEKALEAEIQKDEGFGLLFIDLDDFKTVNDTLGHQVGDELLCAIAGRLAHARNGNVVARLGGDEFVVSLADANDEESATMLSEQVLASIQESYLVAGQHVEIGASIGLSLYPLHGKTASKLMMHADLAMYEAKKRGRNNCQTYCPRLSADMRERMELQRDLRDAIEDDSLFLLFQPQFDINSDSVVGAEGLMRWNHPRLGFIGPDSFINLAIDCGLIGEITEIALLQGMRAAAELRPRFPDKYISVNVSARDFWDPGLLDHRIQNALDHFGLPGDALELELTERVFLEHADVASEMIRGWHEQGIQLAIDDFGTGFSSLKYLLDLPIDKVKIDRTFVDSIESDNQKQNVVRTILTLAQSFNATCVAEGVQSESELNCLRKLGCSQFQGFLLGHPMHGDDLMEFLATSSSFFASVQPPSIQAVVSMSSSVINRIE